MVDPVETWRGYHKSFFVSPSGKELITAIPADTPKISLQNGLSRLNLLTASFVKSQQIKAAFGYTEYWKEIAVAGQADFFLKKYQKFLKKPIISDIPQLAPFSPSDLQGPFYLLVTMYAISFFAFLCELIAGRP